MHNLAQEAYEAYGDEVGWVNYQGIPMPRWEDLTDKVKDGWHYIDVGRTGAGLATGTAAALKAGQAVK